jgi:hypothetical protein
MAATSFFQVLRNGRSDIWAMREKSDLLHRLDKTPFAITTGPLNYYLLGVAECQPKIVRHRRAASR